MSTNYRLEVSTFWKHPQMYFGRWRQQVYDFTTATLVQNERAWADGQDFYDVNRSPHIYADKETADAVYDELDFSMDEWEPLGEIIFEGSGERLVSYHLIGVDEDGNETVEAECDVLELLAMMNETAKSSK